MIPSCPRCGKNDFKKTRDLTTHLKRKFKCKPLPAPKPVSRPQSPTPAPVVHVRGKDWRRKKPEFIQAPIPQDQGGENDSETDSGPLTQESEFNEVERQDTHIDKHARKPREHLKTWGARLRRRWVEVTGEERDLPLNLKECQRLYYDLLQADDEAFEEIIPQEMGPSEIKRQDAHGVKKKWIAWCK